MVYLNSRDFDTPLVINNAFFEFGHLRFDAVGVQVLVGNARLDVPVVSAG